jgi:tRNA threonylcarbamoyladenosine biosynthesis protein TsaB
VSHGPGSYTGLRIGVSAKGLCYALDPLIAVDTLKILAAQAPVSDGLIIPMIDARRMDSAIFTLN